MVSVLKGIKLRLYPNKQQERDLRQMCGNDRFLWNKLNEMLQSRYENNKHLYNGDKSKEAKKKRKYVMLSAYDMNYLLPLMKVEFPFLEYSDSSALQVVTSNLNKAYSNFVKKPEQFGLPKFKKRGFCKLSYTGKSTISILAKRYLKLPKLGCIETSKTGVLKDVKIKRYTIEQDSTNRWYITFQVEAMDKNMKVINPRNLLDFINVEKARVTKAKSQKRLANKRKDFLHKLSTNLVKTYDIIVIEDLKSKNMMKNHKLAKAIGNASWYEFRTMLEYKCQWDGKQLIIVPPHYTSQECSKCHYNSGKKTLDIREWTCESCGVHHDRDINASKNSLTKGLKSLQTM